MARSAWPWLIAGGAAVALVYLGTRRADHDAASDAADDADPEPSLRNASLSYRSIGASGRYPDWIRELRGKSGVYVIREQQRDGSNPIVYVGQSQTGRLYQTLTRHFQGWRRSPGSKKYHAGRFTRNPGHDPGLTYERRRSAVAVRVLPPDRAMTEEARLIERLRPRDNLVGQPESPDEEVIPF